MSPRRIAVLGDGGWGTALSLLLFENGHEVRLWSAFPEYAAEMAASRENRKFLAGVAIPKEIVITAGALEALDGADLAVAAIPTQYMRETL
ncbi:MAG: NAD(P)-binding domain-containing protein, partial [Planctomycetota bacterium]